MILEFPVTSIKVLNWNGWSHSVDWQCPINNYMNIHYYQMERILQWLLKKLFFSNCSKPVFPFIDLQFVDDFVVLVVEQLY